MKILEEHIPLIEKALGFKLYQNQVDYLLEKEERLIWGRATGKTVAYCVKLLLSDVPYIRFGISESGLETQVHKKQLFSTLTDISFKLEAVGFKTAKLYYK